jgi:IS30 family transposase
MRKLKYGKNADELAKVVNYLLLPIKSLTNSVTTDNGKEFAKHEKIAKFLNIKVYFTDPYSWWQKETVENTNNLIRQYLPKGTDFETVTDEKRLNYQYILNKRPRKVLMFCSPLNLFNKIL